jgi:DNA primase
VPLIDPDLIERVRSQTNLAELVGQSVKLRRAGANLIGLCPFHQEKSPSFNVSPDRNRARCFGCGWKGDVIEFVMESQGLNFQSAVKHLADLLGIPCDAPAADALPVRRFKRLSPAPERVDSKRCSVNREDCVQSLQMVPVNRWDALWRWLQSKNLTVDDLLRCGPSAGVTRERRLVFFYETGIKVRFDLESSHSCRWVEGFAESPWRIEHADHAGRIYFCEGESDTMRIMGQIGSTSAAIGMPGASYTPTPEMCWRIGAFREVVFCFDGDQAGRTAEARLVPLFRQHARGCTLYRIPMPDGEDCCSVSEKYLSKFIDAPELIR